MPCLRVLIGLGALVSARAQGDESSLVQVHATTVAAHGIRGGHLPPGNGTAANDPAAPKTWMLMYNQLATTEQLAALCKNLAAAAKCKYSGHPSEGGMPLVVVTATEQVLQSMPSLRADSIEVDGPTHLIKPVAQEVHKGLRTVEEEHWGLDRINGRSGLDHNEIIAATGEGINIFSMDTGVQIKNPDFQGRARALVDFAAEGFFTDYEECEPADANCADDKNGHGTHTAGIAVSATYGVAKKATVHAVKVLSDTGMGKWSWFASGIDWVTAHVQKKSIKQSVITASLGGKGPVNTITTAINNANAAGISVVVAAGNEFADSCTYLPARVPAAITVGSTDEFDQMSYFSNYGPCVDVFAPGSHILSLGIDGEAVVFSGTSMAAPFVAGAAALILGQTMDLTPDGISEHLKETASSGCIAGMPAATANKFLYVGQEPQTASCMSLGSAATQGPGAGSLEAQAGAAPMPGMESFKAQAGAAPMPGADSFEASEVMTKKEVAAQPTEGWFWAGELLGSD